MKSQIAHKIKHRQVPNDDFYTPKDLAKKLFKLVPAKEKDIICDNAYGTGNFWFKGLKSNDFLNDNRIVDWYITNPPYSDLDVWLLKSCNARKGFAYLLGLHNLTPKRIEMCEKKGFGITKIYLCKVFKWFGISAKEKNMKKCNCKNYPANWNGKGWKCVNCGKVNYCEGNGEIDIYGNPIRCCPDAPHLKRKI